jgi:hypothetical protein
MKTQRYTTVVTADSRRRVMVPVPFDADQVWGPKPEHRVAGTVNGMGVRGSIDRWASGTASSLDRPGAVITG